MIPNTFHYFFFIGNQNQFIKSKAGKGIPKYKGSIQRNTSKQHKKQRESSTTTPLAQTLTPHKIYKGMRHKGTMCILHQAQRLQAKEDFNPWIDCPSLSKVLLFLSFQTIQKRHKGATHHACFLFFPTKEPCHPNKASLTDEESTHATPKRKNRRHHKTLVLARWRRIWSTDSSSLRQRKHLFAKDHSLL